MLPATGHRTIRKLFGFLGVLLFLSAIGASWYAYEHDIGPVRDLLTSETTSTTAEMDITEIKTMELKPFNVALTLELLPDLTYNVTTSSSIQRTVLSLRTRTLTSLNPDCTTNSVQYHVGTAQQQTIGNKTFFDHFVATANSTDLRVKTLQIGTVFFVPLTGDEAPKPCATPASTEESEIIENIYKTMQTIRPVVR